MGRSSNESDQVLFGYAQGRASLSATRGFGRPVVSHQEARAPRLRPQPSSSRHLVDGTRWSGRSRLVPRTCVVCSVTLATGLVTSFQNDVPRITNLSCNAVTRRPASPPVKRSACRFSLANVNTFPTQNERYSSFRVGARNARPAEKSNER